MADSEKYFFTPIKSSRRFLDSLDCGIYNCPQVVYIPNALKWDTLNRAMDVIKTTNEQMEYLFNSAYLDVEYVSIRVFKGHIVHINEHFQDIIKANEELQLDNISESSCLRLAINTIATIEYFYSCEFDPVQLPVIEIMNDFTSFNDNSPESFCNNYVDLTDLTDRICFIDAEFVQSHMNKSVLASVSVIGYNGQILLDAKACPRERVVNYITQITGFVEEDLIGEMDEYSILDYCQRLFQGRIIIGHGLSLDIKVLQMKLDQLFGLVDTSINKLIIQEMNLSSYNVGLKRVTEYFRGQPFQQGVHSSLQDAEAVREVFLLMADKYGLVDTITASIEAAEDMGQRKQKKKQKHNKHRKARRKRRSGEF